MRTIDRTPQYPKRTISLENQPHSVYSSLHRGLAIDRPNRASATVLTYIPMSRGLVCLLAILAWCWRKPLSLHVANTLDASPCIQALEGALETRGAAKIFDPVPGIPLTSEDFNGMLKCHDIRRSMYGSGRRIASAECPSRTVKHKEGHLDAYDSIAATRVPFGGYPGFYSAARQHQSLDRRTPNSVYYQFAAGLAALPEDALIALSNLRGPLPGSSYAEVFSS